MARYVGPGRMGQGFNVAGQRPSGFAPGPQRGGLGGPDYVYYPGGTWGPGKPTPGPVPDPPGGGGGGQGPNPPQPGPLGPGGLGPWEPKPPLPGPTPGTPKPLGGGSLSPLAPPPPLPLPGRPPWLSPRPGAGGATDPQLPGPTPTPKPPNIPYDPIVPGSPTPFTPSYEGAAGVTPLTPGPTPGRPPQWAQGPGYEVKPSMSVSPQPLPSWPATEPPPWAPPPPLPFPKPPPFLPPGMGPTPEPGTQPGGAGEEPGTTPGPGPGGPPTSAAPGMPGWRMGGTAPYQADPRLKYGQRMPWTGTVNQPLPARPMTQQELAQRRAGANPLATQTEQRRQAGLMQPPRPARRPRIDPRTGRPLV